MSSIKAPFGPDVPFNSKERTAYWTVSRVRQTFLDYFCQEHQHTFVPSSSTIPHEDPTLLFANSGMTQFKPVFQGVIDPSAPFAKLTRAANSQKCIRAGGKHNDLEDVGKDVYHHTFFEMLGNWSFGNYFKKEAIEWAWRLLTEVYGMPKERLYVTYFEGNEKLGLPADTEAKELWLNVGVAPERVLPFSMKENFWEMGETGPCGPCTEIHFDRIGGRDASASVNRDDPDVLEIWNLVFMQFNREVDGSLRPLPAKHVDTGAGLERVTSVLQNKRSNYDTDVFAPIFAAIQATTGARPYSGKVGKAEDLDGIDMAYRVVADHIRTLTFAISDGGMPSNEGRGYVLRRILRRAIRYAHEKLNAPPGAFASLVDVVVENFGDAFPELRKAPHVVKEVLKEEETQFRKTLDRGLVQFAKFAKTSTQNQISGPDAWRLYDTYGFPIDLVKIMAEEQGMSVDERGYLQCQEAAREQSRAANKSLNDANLVQIDVHLAAELETKWKIPPTDDTPKYTQPLYGNAKIVAFVVGGELKGEASHSNDLIGIILDSTNLYAEEGGQLYDTGSITIDGQCEFRVDSVKAAGGYILHVGQLKYGSAKVNDKVVCVYDEQRRRSLRLNHTATHALNFAIRRVLGPHNDAVEIEQRGSLVAPDKFRFDFNFKSAPTDEQILAIETIVNDLVEKKLVVDSQSTPLSVAKGIHGLRAVFGETYPDPVRVVAIGVKLAEILADPTNDRWTGYSIELCGGTHVGNTADIKQFVITSEATIAKGIRRIVAVTGEQAIEAQKEAKGLETGIIALESKVKEGNLLANNFEAYEIILRDLTRDIDDAQVSHLTKAAFRDRLAHSRKLLTEAAKAAKAEQARQAVEVVTQLVSSLTVNGSTPKIVVYELKVSDNGKALLAACQAAVKAFPAALFYSTDQMTSRLYYHAMCAKTAGISAVDVARAFGDVVGGKSGGSVEVAQGSAPLAAPDQSLDALRKASERVKELFI